MAYGSASDIEINAEEIVKLRVRYNHQIVGRGVRQDAWSRSPTDADRDFWLSPEEARKYGTRRPGRQERRRAR